VILIWNGLGILVIPVVIIGAVAGGAIAQFEPNIRWPRMIAVLGTSLALFGLGILLNRPKVAGHDRFGNAVTAKEDHSLYWIPVQYWSAITLVIGTILVFKK
jgi:ribose/xylose/arabinose/galactoside ABC-type transport system permease subunit